ncbi:hypothetical protein F5972_13535 [Microbispora cellulosiformans]|uniref:Uncharacterized protein n=1 Tax=Microbispora cellulosiformans TaxID=2614688 RepID=A0A5J5K508_9ACTN|nr:hypothetical protein [Microbispora cellulosiformans]KAA9379199.1 hypothetical protein F5972_13535 [Microbispora cellulosiformans]
MIRTYPRSSQAKAQQGLNLRPSAQGGSHAVPVAFEEAARGVVTALGEVGAEHASAIVNVVGPLGVGKSRLLATLSSGFVDLSRTPDEVHLSGGAPLAVDGVDTDRRADAVSRFLDRAGHGRFLIASRLPLAARPRWAHRPIVTVELRPWSPAGIRGLARALGVPDPAHADLVVRLSGGIPLIADSLCRAILRGGEPGPEGALADAAATEVLRRLSAESRGLPPGALPIVAAVDGADEDLLTALVRLPSRAFSRLRRLSVIRPDRHGLTVAEPYRTLFDLAYRWRHPVLRDEMAARAAEHRHRQLAHAADPPLRARIADQVLYLSGRRRARRDLYADERGEFSVRRAADGDDEAIGRLLRLWGEAEGLAERQVDRMRDLWLSGADHGFHLAVDSDDHAVGMTNLTPLDPDAAPALEPLLQQYADTVLNLGRCGSVVGMLAVEPRFARAQPALVRHILTTGMAGGGLVVSTPWIPYQEMAARFGLRRIGDTRHDVYRCGRPSALYARTFTEQNMSAWLRRMRDPRSEGPGQTAELVRTALRGIRTQARTSAAGPRPEPALADLMRQAVEALASSASAVDAEAGEILRLYYLTRAGGHDLLAHRLHLSRATYFRRLEYGIGKVAEAVSRALTAPEPLPEHR